MPDLVNNFLSTKIPMVEIFHSISGEGVSAGNIVTFVRVAGCDLRCTWCDTKYSFKTRGHNVPQMLPEEILAQVKKIGTREIICTGGEPLEHDTFKRYLPAYLQANGFKVRIETSGGSLLYNKEELDVFNLSIERRPQYTMDIKCPASKMEQHNKYENLQHLDKRDELKFVVASDEDLTFSMKVIKDHVLKFSKSQITLNFSPVFEAMEPAYLAGFLKQNSAYFESKKLLARLSLQLHKFIWPPHQRGV